MPPDSIALVAGEPRRHTMVADSGAAVFREFCAQCGTHLFSGGEAYPQFESVKITALDDPARISPVAHVWTESLIAWGCIDDNLPRFSKQAGMAELERLWKEAGEHARRRTSPR
jgi:hypothetical protein